MRLLTVSMFATFVVVPLTLGVVVYIGWRSTTLLVFGWMEIVGIPVDIWRSTVTLPPLILYSFPDGCWVFAGTSWMFLIWKRLNSWVAVFVLLGTGSEVGQGVGIIPGTFEWNDLTSYIAGFTISCIGHHYAKMYTLNDRLANHVDTRGRERRQRKRRT